MSQSLHGTCAPNSPRKAVADTSRNARRWVGAPAEVSRQTNPLYWELIDQFRQRTGIPLILNTSLNENEPIVRVPSEAVAVFERTAMDVIVVGNWVLSRAASHDVA